MPLDQFTDLPGDGGGKENGLAFLRCRVEDFFDIVAEPHVQHTVRFVENDHFHLVERQRAPVHVVHQAAGGSDHDLDAFFQLVELPFVGSAPVDRNRMDAFLVGGQFVDFVRHLGRQLARGAQNENLHRAVGCLAELDRGNTECGGFSRSRHGLADHVVPFHEDRDRGRLDRGRLFEAEVGNRFQDLGRQPQIGKILLVHGISLALKPARVTGCLVPILPNARRGWGGGRRR